MILGWNPVESKAGLPPAPFEISDGVLRMMAPLWGKNHQIEAFFVSVFVNEFCSLLPGAEMMAARENDLVRFERAVVISAWMVFLSLHVGAADQAYLDALRLSVFRKVLGTEVQDPSVPRIDDYSDAGELFKILDETLVGDSVFHGLGADFFESRFERVAQKIIARLARVQKEKLAGPSPLSGSIFGEKGFVDG
jgi:hypothetical protein